VRDVDKPFLMAIEDVFSITGRGTVVTGRVEQGVLKKMGEVEIVGIKDTRKTTATDLEMFRKLLDEVQAGDNVGVLLRGVDKDEVARGQVLAKPGSVTPHTDFTSQVYVLSKEEGGRHTPFFTGYRPQFYFRTTDVTGSANLPEGVEMVMPGDNIEMTVSLGAPIAMEEGLRFAIREGGRTVGAGRVTKIIKSRTETDEGKRRSGRTQDPHQAPRLRPPDAGRRGSRDRRARDSDRGQGRGARAAADRAVDLHRDPLSAQVQGQPRALPDAHAQAAHRHRRRHVEDGSGAPTPEPVGRRRHRDQVVGTWQRSKESSGRSWA
jgi:hypothetical protein